MYSTLIDLYTTTSLSDPSEKIKLMLQLEMITILLHFMRLLLVETEK